jgi:hypothetical protein
MSARKITAVAATLALAVPAAAAADGKAKGVGDLFLGRTSNGAALDYELDRTPRKQVVTIAGKRAKVKVIEEDGDRFYRAFVVRNGLEAGRSYRVEIKLRTRSGKVVVHRDALYLHRSLNRPAAGR